MTPGRSSRRPSAAQSAMLALLLALLLAAGSARAGTWAVAIGNNAPPIVEAEQLAQLRYADDDAARFYELFVRLGAHVELLSVLD